MVAGIAAVLWQGLFDRRLAGKLRALASSTTRCAPLPKPPSPAARRLWLPRIAIGLAQGVEPVRADCKAAALQSVAGQRWLSLFRACRWRGFFAPLLLLEGLGDIPIALLALVVGHRGLQRWAAWVCIITGASRTAIRRMPAWR